jgi:hypothetical protein
VTENLKRYLRNVAARLIDDLDNGDERDELWDLLTLDERDHANAFVCDVFGEWL